jgi:Glycosyl transferase family 2
MAEPAGPAMPQPQPQPQQPSASAPLVTVLLLAYNQQATVGAAIAGALAQTYAQVELVISDDASTDATYAAMLAAVADYRGPHRVILNRNPVNLGIGAHLNRMVALSHGELLFVAAGDDVSQPQRCERVVQAWLDAGRCPDLIAAALVDMDEHGGLHEVIAPTDLSTYRSAADWLARPPHVIGAAQAWTRRLYDRCGPLPDAAMAEDMLMVFRAILAGGAITLAEPLVHYRRGGVSRRARALSAADVTRRLLKNNRHALAELPQLLADAQAAGQLDAVEAELTARLARERFIEALFATRGTGEQVTLAWRTHALPWSLRARLLTYAAFPWLLAPFFALKRRRARGD